MQVFPCLIIVIIFFFLFSQLKSSYWGDPGWKIGDADDMVARNAYESLLRFNLFNIDSLTVYRRLKIEMFSLSI